MKIKQALVWALLIPMLSFLVVSCNRREHDKDSELAGTITSSPIEEKYGVIIHGISLSAGGYMLDFRYTVTDPERSKPFFDKATAPYLIDNVSGAKMKVPSPAKVGPLRTSGGLMPEKDRRYFIIFANPGAFIKKGNKVTIVIGDIKIENLIVQ